MSPIDHLPGSPKSAARSLSIGDAQPIDEADTPAAADLPVVVVGASAGGVEALRRLFSLLPADNGCAFVVVTHLSPERESMLAPLIGAATPMRAVQVDADVSLVADRIYVAPPGRYLEAFDGRLRTRKMQGRTPKPIAIDQCMISIATAFRERAIGVVLTGADGDGAMGIKAIKMEGGFTLVQSPDTAAYPDMPNQALATGLVDSTMTVEEMPEAILQYVRHLRAGRPGEDPSSVEQNLPELLSALRQSLGLDFHAYKTPMLRRRIQRRMALLDLTDANAYLERVRSDEVEARSLANDFLINVTEFFREPHAWNVMADEVLPGLLAAKQPGSSVRVWVPACATGEEAYSLAMLLLEQPLVHERQLKIQVFGTDVDRNALETARRGRYGSIIEVSVGQERLRRFFGRVPGGFEVKRELRELVLFAPHDIMHDPPFSRMDLVSCRNLLIYLTSDTQRRVLQALHFALEPTGFLALGKSESVGAASSIFASVFDAAKIFRRLGPARAPLASVTGQIEARPERPFPVSTKSVDYEQLVRDSLAERPGTAAILTDAEGRLLFLSPGLRPYLDSPEGRPTQNLFAYLVPALRSRVRVALFKALQTSAEVRRDIPVTQGDGASMVVRVTVVPVAPSETRRLLVVHLETVDATAGHRGAAPIDVEDDAMALLEEELQHTKEELRTVVEELELANEELKVANEEAMSMNEELQSSNEELETSKEELQSINEELTSVNDQLHEKVQELERVNDDMVNLLTSTHIPALFLDRQLNIKRFTPAATRLFRLLPGDVNRPITDLASNSDLLALVDDARRVLDTLVPVQNEAHAAGGEIYLRRTLPYRTHDDHIDGVVVTFTDITEVKETAEALSRYSAVLQASTDAIIMLDAAGCVQSWNQGAAAMYGYTAEEMDQQSFLRLVPEDLQASYTELLARAFRGSPIAAHESRRVRSGGETLDVSATISVVPSAAGRAEIVALIERDVSERKRADEALRASEQRFRSLADNTPVLVFVADASGTLQFVNSEFARFVGDSETRLIGRRWFELLHREDRLSVREVIRNAPAHDARVELTARVLHHDGGARWVKVIARRRNEELAEGAGWIGSMVDIDAQVASEHALRQADARKDEFLAMLGHELRNPLAPIRNAAAVLERVETNDPRVRWVCNLLDRQVDHVTQLVDDLLDISRVARGTLRLYLAPVDVRQSVEHAIESVQPLLRSKSHRVNISLGEDAVWVQGDAIRLTQLFDNLVTNAVKYTEPGGEISVLLTASDSQVQVTVRDNGIGIEPAMLGRVFELFVQDERSVNRSQGGLGIGLSLARHLVELHRGTIEARSAGKGLGSEFVVTLPRLHQVNAPPADQSSTESGSRSGCVLIVDDDNDAGESLLMLLELYGYDAEYQNTVESAIDAARRLRPDVVLLDLAMPNADGYEVASRMRQLPRMRPTMQFVAITGFAQEVDVARSREEGFARHLSKPVNASTLDEVLRELITRHAVE